MFDIKIYIIYSIWQIQKARKYSVVFLCTEFMQKMQQKFPSL